MPLRLRNIIAGIMILAATACLVLGLTLPVVRMSYLHFWTHSYSLAAIVKELYQANELFLAGTIFLFSIVFPAFKLVYLLIAYVTPRNSDTGALHRCLSWLGKWSMLDVLVLALVVFYAKSSSLADAVALPGVYLFAASVILTMLAYGFIEVQTERQEKWQSPQLIENNTRSPDSAPSLPDRARPRVVVRG